MLSISNVSNSKAAAGYYEAKDDYYSGGQREGQWFGHGANSLGLIGAVSRDQFIGLLRGELPGGATIHNAASGHRGGVDLTFSAPKSVSLMALLAGDDRVATAHSKAVEKALLLAQERAGYRHTVDQVTEHRRSNNLVVARFTHELSRACDPQLHTHCVVLNATRRVDGQWRALDNEPLYRAKMLMGAAYRAELARELQTIGYEVQVTHPDGRFEVKGFDTQILKTFSQRSQSMDEYLQRRCNLPSDASAIERKQAAIATRAAKTEVDRASLIDAWQQRLTDLGVQVPHIPSMTSEEGQAAFTAKDAGEAVTKAINHLSERESAFNRDDLTCAALQFGTGNSTHTDVVREINVRLDAGTLISAGEVMTTPELQQEEVALLKAELAERNTVPRLTSNTVLPFTSATLSAEQAMAVHHVLSCTSRLVGLVGKAGTGKTTTLKTAVDGLQAAQLPVFGVAPSSSAARMLAETGVGTATVASFLRNGMDAKLKGGLLIVDEAGMLSTKQVSSLLQRAKQHDFRIVLVGDPRQLAAVEAGKPYAQLLSAGMPTATLKTIHRQKNSVLKAAVELASNGRVGEAVSAIKHRISEVPDRDDRLDAVATAYAALPAVERDSTIVLSGTRASRERLNQLIRTKLGLAGSGHLIQTLEKRSLTKQQAASLTAYEVGDALVANRDYKSLGLRRGDQARVVGFTTTTVLLVDSAGREFDWSPALATDLSAHRVVEREIGVGDRIRITDNMHTVGLLNGDELEVTSLDKEHATCTLALADGSLKQLNLSAPLPIDHAYCRTVYASQGATCDRVFIEADTASLTANEATFYVAISRARSSVSIFTNDASRMAPAMARSSSKASALDVKAHHRNVEIGLS